MIESNRVDNLKRSMLVFFLSIFIASIILYKKFFFDIGVVSLFLTAAVLTGVLWNVRKSSVVLYFLGKLQGLPFANIFFTLATYCLLFLPTEFILTEKLYKIPKVPQIFPLVILILLSSIFSLIDFRTVFRKKFFIVLFIIFWLFSGFVYIKYRKEKLDREYLPKIYSFSPLWGVQAQLITIKGVNFGPSWKGGKVFLGSLETTIRNWQDDYLLVEQPVSSPFGNLRLKVIRRDGVESNLSLPYEVRNPDRL